MGKVVKTLALFGAVSLLSACTMTCDEVGEYNGEPYSQERMAGNQVDSDGTSCHFGGDRESFAYSDERTKASDGQPQENSSLK